MAGNTIGKSFCVTTWGESHGAAIGAVVDGCPAGLTLSLADIQGALDRRKPGGLPSETSRREADQVEIHSGVFEDRTTGTPIALIIYNRDHASHDYDRIRGLFRPGHGDFTYAAKYGFRDHRGADVPLVGKQRPVSPPAPLQQKFAVNMVWMSWPIRSCSVESGLNTGKYLR